MNKWDYLYEVDALRASPALRAKVASLPNRRRRKTRSFSWVGLASTLVLAVGLGLATLAILRAVAPPGGQLDPPPVVTHSPAPEGIIAEGIDVSPVILDAAREYVEAQYRTWTQSTNVDGAVFGAVFDNWRIEAVDSIYDSKELGDFTVAVWRLEYRIHTTTPENINLIESMELDSEGWLSLNAPGSTYLVFLLNYSTPHSFSTVIRKFSPGSTEFDATIQSEIEAYLAPLTEQPTEADPWGITLQAESVTNTGLTLVCEQSGGTPTGELMTGRAYTLERLTDVSTWESVDTATGENPNWTLEGWKIPKDDTARWQVNFHSLYPVLAHGTYRIGKEIMDYRAPGDYDEKTYYAEFTVSGPDNFSNLDFMAYKDVMTNQEWADMNAFLPVLLEGSPFRWTDSDLKARGDITLDEFLPQIWSMAEGETELHLWRLAVADADGDGRRELVLALKDAGYHYLILHREGDKFYGIDFPVRWFEGLQTNGVFWSSGGAADQDYYRMTFQDGTFATEHLGSNHWWSGENGTFDIGGQEVDADTFVAWRDALLVGEVAWYGPISKGQT